MKRVAWIALILWASTASQASQAMAGPSQVGGKTQGLRIKLPQDCWCWA